MNIVSSIYDESCNSKLQTVVIGQCIAIWGKFVNNSYNLLMILTQDKLSSFPASMMSIITKLDHHCHRHLNWIIIVILVIIVIIVIIITRPKPAYGRQGLAGSWGQDTDQAGTFRGVLNVSLRASGAQLGYKPICNYEKP